MNFPMCHTKILENVLGGGPCVFGEAPKASMLSVDRARELFVYEAPVGASLGNVSR